MHPLWGHCPRGPSHGRPGREDAQLVESDVIRSAAGRHCAAIDIDKCVDIPACQETVGRQVVMGEIKTDVPWEKPVSVTAEIINRIKEVLAVMPPRAGKVHQEGTRP